MSTPPEADSSRDASALGSEPEVLALLDTNCGEDPRGATDYPVPASLGNGLVYDARYGLFGRPRNHPEDPVPLESYLDDFREVGFRPVQLDVKPFWDDALDTMRWDLPEYFPTLIADEDANHLVEVVRDLTDTELSDDANARVAEGGWRALSIVPYMADVDGSQLYSAIWVRDGSPFGTSTAITGQTPQQLKAWFETHASEGFRPISLEGETHWNQEKAGYDRRFTFVAVQDEIGAQQSWAIGWDLKSDADLENDIVAKALQGFVPFYVSTSHSYPEIELAEDWFHVLYVPATPAVPQQPDALEVQHATDLNDAELYDKNQFWRAQGYHLVSFASYRNDGDITEKLYAAIWHRYGRTRWEETVVGEISEAGEEFQPLEDAVRGVMADNMLLSGTADTNIPAVQLAVMKGDELVLSRAYTRAPIAYAPITTGTPLMAGSITKPVTAVATLRAVGVSGLTGDLMDLVPEPTMGGKPTGITVRRALQHTSGWTLAVSALTVKDAMQENRMPTSMDWLEYMAQLGPPYGLTGTPGTFSYSNFGYDMLALALKEQAGIDPDDPDNEYESVLMADEIFDQVGMCKTRFKRQGLVDGDGTAWPEPEPEYGACNGSVPCMALGGRGYYLTEDDHPYWGDLEHEELANPGLFERSALDDDVPAPPYLRRQTYGGNDAVHAHLGSAALVSTAEDLARFMVSFRPYFTDYAATSLLTAQQAATMFPTNSVSGGGGSDCTISGRVNAGGGPTMAACYGLGWYVGNDSASSTDVWNHGGDVDGAVTMLLYHPETDATVAVLFARHPFTSIAMGNAIDQQILDVIAANGFAPLQLGPLTVEDNDPLPTGYPGW